MRVRRFRVLFTFPCLTEKKWGVRAGKRRARRAKAVEGLGWKDVRMEDAGGKGKEWTASG